MSERGDVGDGRAVRSEPAQAVRRGRMRWDVAAGFCEGAG